MESGGQNDLTQCNVIQKSRDKAEFDDIGGRSANTE